MGTGSHLLAILNPRDIGHLHFPISWPSSSICDKSIDFGFIVSFAHFGMSIPTAKWGINTSGVLSGSACKLEQASPEWNIIAFPADSPQSISYVRTNFSRRLLCLQHFVFIEISPKCESPTF